MGILHGMCQKLRRPVEDDSRRKIVQKKDTWGA